MDASEPLSEQDIRIVTMVIEAGRALVIAYNKWDLTDEERRKYLEREIDRDLVQVPWAPSRSRAGSRPAQPVTRAQRSRLSGWRNSRARPCCASAASSI